MPIDTHLSYLQKNAFCPPQIAEAPHRDLGMVVVIPCFNEADLTISLQALWESQRPGCAVEVITVVNSGVHHPPEILAQNARTVAEAQEWIAAHQDERLRFHVLHMPDLPRKHAGVGLARKIGMDEAVQRLHLVEQEEAPIICFDADARCAPNYLAALEQHFLDHPKTPGCSIHYEHPLAGDYDDAVYAGILRYELYLRYYVLALRHTGHPHAYHTIGSSMAVRSKVYQQQGGMNRRKAGEDFHFLQKLIPLGHFSEVKSTMVIPSPRPSDRVPFGTGKAIGDWLEDQQLDYPVYNPQIFEELKSVLSGVRSWYGMNADELKQVLAQFPPDMQAYFQQESWVDTLLSIQGDTSSLEAFVKRFYRWFNGLKALQCVHHARDHAYANVALLPACQHLCRWLELEPPTDLLSMLHLVRKYEREARPFQA